MSSKFAMLQKSAAIFDYFGLRKMATSAKKLKLENLLPNARVWGIMAQFGKPIDQETKEYLEEEGLGDGRTRAIGCLGWIWSQWLLQTSPTAIREQVEPFVERGMEMQELSSKFSMRPLHDIYLLQCAIFASDEAQLKKLAQRVVDTGGYRNYRPRNDGELYISAWSGMLKHWILGNTKKAREQSEVIWDAYRDISCRAATKPLVTPWLNCDWEGFRKSQERILKSCGPAAEKTAPSFRTLTPRWYWT